MLKALDVLEAKRGASFSGPEKDNPGAISAREMAAGNRLFEALIHAREVALRWDGKARNRVSEARDLLRGHYRDPRYADAPKDDLNHCEQAVKAFERSRFAEKIKAGRKSLSERGKDQGRERE